MVAKRVGRSKVNSFGASWREQAFCCLSFLLVLICSRDVAIGQSIWTLRDLDGRAYPEESYNSDGGATTVVVNAPGSWSWSDDSSWIVLSGTTANTLIYDVRQNTGTSPRVGVITFRSGGQTRTHIVRQEASIQDWTLRDLNGRAYPEESYNSYGGATTVVVNASGSWSWSDDSSWIVLSGTTANTLIYDVRQNTGTSPRVGVITFRSGGQTRTHTVRQEASIPDWTLRNLNGRAYPEESYNSDGGATTVVVNAPGSWSWIDDSSWIVLSGTTANTLIYDVRQNTGTSPRVGVITFRSGGQTRTHTVRQDAPTQNWTLRDLNGQAYPEESYNSDGGATTVVVNAPGSWSWIDDSSWIVLSGTTANTLIYDVRQNTGTSPRVGVITFRSGGQTRTHTVRQDAPIPDWTLRDLDGRAYPEESYNSDGGATTVVVNAPGSWSWSDDSSWIVLSGTTANTLIYDVRQNTGTSPRVGVITFRSGGQTRTHTVRQEAPIPDWTLRDLNGRAYPEESYNSDGGATTVVVNAPGSWTWSDDSSWIVLSGRTSSTLIYDVRQNTGTSPRVGVITFRSNGQTRTHTVRQGTHPGPILRDLNGRAYPEESYNSDGGATTVVVNAPGSWTWSDDSSWIVLSGTTPTTFIYDVRPNTGASPRVGVITFRSGGQTWTHTVRQSGVFTPSGIGISRSANGKIEISWTDSITIQLEVASTAVGPWYPVLLPFGEGRSPYRFDVLDGPRILLPPGRDPFSKGVYIFRIRDLSRQ